MVYYIVVGVLGERREMEIDRKEKRKKKRPVTRLPVCLPFVS